jgi:hypothetical protein
MELLWEQLRDGMTDRQLLQTSVASVKFQAHVGQNACLSGMTKTHTLLSSRSEAKKSAAVTGSKPVREPP